METDVEWLAGRAVPVKVYKGQGDSTDFSGEGTEQEQDKEQTGKIL